MTTPDKVASYRVSLPETIRFGPGVLDTLAGDVEKMGVKKALIVTDPGIYQSGLVQPVKEQLSGATVAVDTYSEAEPEPSLSGLNNAARKFKKATTTLSSDWEEVRA
jgi:choline dehydrogenase